jgi:hypothetical protein
MRVTANRQLTGHYGVVSMGQEFDADEDVARQLLRAGLVKRPDPPAMVYETKVIVPEVPEAAPRDAFRDVSLPDTEPAGMAPESNRELSEADLPAQRIDDPRGRAGRKASGAGARSANQADPPGG